MLKNKKVLLGGILLIFIALIVVQHYAPRPVDWTENYDFYSNTPYGCSVTNDLLTEIFPKQEITYNNNVFFEYADTLNFVQKNIVVITNNFSPDRYDLKVLLREVAKGNDLFVAAESFGNEFMDTLQFGTKLQLNLKSKSFDAVSETLYLENLLLKEDSGYRYEKIMPLVDIIKCDTLKTTILGKNRIKHVNFIRISYGRGQVYIHTQPLAFTNYNLLYGNIEYVSKALSYLPYRATVCDNFYKPFPFVNTSPVRHILTQPALKSAYYLLLATLLIYMLFESKRRQRIIPVIKQPTNRSVEFVKTVGQLYFKQSKHIDLARKMMLYFKEFLRERYFITQVSASADCIERVSEKTGVSYQLIEQLLKSDEYYAKAELATMEGLIELNRKLELFYHQRL